MEMKKNEMKYKEQVHAIFWFRTARSATRLIEAGYGAQCAWLLYYLNVFTIDGCT